MIPPDLAAKIAQLKALVVKGMALYKAAAEVGLKPTLAHTLAVRTRMPRRRRAMPDGKRKRLHKHIEAAKLTLTKIAAKVQVSKGTVCKHRQQLATGKAKYRPQRLQKPVRCPNGHLLIERGPCRTCMMRGDL